MILPNIRASFGRRDAMHLVGLIASDDEALRESVLKRLDAEGIDTLLDDPRVRNALLTDTRASASPELIFYVLVRQALLEGGVNEPAAADYVSALLLKFGQERRAYRVSDDTEDEYQYLVDIAQGRHSADARQSFLLNTHMGNLSLWLAGLFPQYLHRREQRRGAPPVRYYEQMGESGYRLASESREAVRFGLGGVLSTVADRFSDVRVALNRLSDRLLWPSGGDPIQRLFREVEQRAGA